MHGAIRSSAGHGRPEVKGDPSSLLTGCRRPHPRPLWRRLPSCVRLARSRRCSRRHSPVAPYAPADRQRAGPSRPTRATHDACITVRRLNSAVNPGGTCGDERTPQSRADDVRSGSTQDSPGHEATSNWPRLSPTRGTVSALIGSLRQTTSAWCSGRRPPIRLAPFPCAGRLHRSAWIVRENGKKARLAKLL